jgi:hypothetical protein
MPQNSEGFANAIHELRLNIEAALTDNEYYRAAQKLHELREVAGQAVAALAPGPAAAAGGSAAVRSALAKSALAKSALAKSALAKSALAKSALAKSAPVKAAPRAAGPETQPPGFGDALAALRASIKMEVWDDRYYEAVRLINVISDAATAAGMSVPQARLPHPHCSVADSLRWVRRAAAAELRDNVFYSVTRYVQLLTELLPQAPREAPEPAAAPTGAAPQTEASGAAKPRSFDDLAAASARRVARLAHPASSENGEFFDRHIFEPWVMGERQR